MLKIIKLDWYKDYGIEVVNSVKLYEKYAIPDSENVKLIVETYSFIFDYEEYRKVNGLDSFKEVRRVLTQIEKLVLLKEIYTRNISYEANFGPLSYIGIKKIEGDVAVNLRWESLTDSLLDVKDGVLREDRFSDSLKSEENEKIVFQSRASWEFEIFETDGVCEKCGSQNDPVEKAKLRARFVFGIINKNAKRIEV